MEVGFSQCLASLRQKAIEWFQDLSELHTCIFITDITKQSREYIDSAGKKISAEKLRND